MADVTIYSTPWCTYCKMAKDFFAQNNVPFVEKDVSVDEAARDTMVKSSGQLGVPVIEIVGEDKKVAVVIGFDKKKLISLLGIKAG